MKPYSRPSGRYRNEPEARLAEIAIANGWEPTKRGWPDFICFKGDDVMVVEVKPNPNHTLKPSQLRIMKALSRAGIPCFYYSPAGGFERIQSESDISESDTTADHNAPISGINETTESKR